MKYLYVAVLAEACRIAPSCKRRAPAPWTKDHHERFAARERWFHLCPGRQGLPLPNDESRDWNPVVERPKPDSLVRAQRHDYPEVPQSTMPKSAAIAGPILPAGSETPYCLRFWVRSWLRDPPR